MATYDNDGAASKPVDAPKKRGKKRKGIDDQQFLAILASEWQQSIGHATDPLASVQDDALLRYLGKPYGDEVEGRSQIISRDCAQVVDWALPDLMEPFVSGDNVVEFDPTKRELVQPSQVEVMMAQAQGKQPPQPKDVSQEKADQATEYLNYIFSVENNGFEVLYNVFKAGLIQKIGIAKIWWDESEATVEETLHHVSLVQLQQLQEDDDVEEIVDLEPDDIDEDVWSTNESLQAAYPDRQAFTVTLRRKKQEGRLKVASVPPDEFRISSRATKVDSYYTAHETERTVSELIEMGFDPEKVFELPMATYENEQREKLRFDPENRKMNDLGISDKSRRKVRLLEEHIYCDRNGDGVAECVQVFRVQNVILEEKEVPENPYAVFCPSPLPHRLIGESLVDKAKHIQRANTVMWRQALDNLYLSNMPRKLVGSRSLTSDGSTMTALLNPTVGQIIPCEDPTMIVSEEVQDRSAGALQMIQFMTNMREADTGVTRNGAALDSEVIDPKTATESRNQDRNEQSRKRLMARVAAEMFLVPLFSKMLRCICRYQDYERTVKLRGKWTSFDPRAWDANLSARISVGLGHPNREDEVQAAQTVLLAQQQMLPLGMIKPEHVFKAYSRLIKAVGWRDAQDYAIDPSKDELISQDKPDPKMAEVQGKLQAKQAEMQANMQFKQQEAQLDAQNMQMQAALEQWKAQQQMELERKKMEMEAALAVRQQEFEARMAEREMQFEMRLAQQEAAVKAEIAKKQAENAHSVQMTKATGKLGGSGVRFGGDIG